MLQVSLLGPLEITVGGRPVPVTARRAMRFLAALALAGGRPVAIPGLVESVWADRPPATAEAQLQTVVWRLRAALAEAGLPAGTIARRSAGYLLPREAFRTDLARFRTDVETARAELGRGRTDEAAGILRSALDRWRGPALLGIGGGATLAAAVERMEEERQRAHEQCVRLDVLRGRHHAVSVELRELVALHPLRESLVCTLALALYRSGRQTDALGVLRRTRDRLRDRLGMDPGRELVRVEQAILRQSLAFSAAENRLELRQIERALEG
ncbi:AfsR/SARP family transcriptional regulator [Streptomyces aidingensis]|uniref:DNA-binding transcriptional activator of the SARP family n=1 Tax=Streptomyces aidingensis TaxID=910347 RepID=A0A1I1SS46_9ACTN|nr:AfsR/SARP family transcriptional regulator [Streptomyces aidingensis]SFD46733.1 DNA-binding transcriptional activator of the SARP family [Streptomyces aidingensis]